MPSSYDYIHPYPYKRSAVDVPNHFKQLDLGDLFLVSAMQTELSYPPVSSTLSSKVQGKQRASDQSTAQDSHIPYVNIRFTASDPGYLGLSLDG